MMISCRGMDWARRSATCLVATIGMLLGIGCTLFGIRTVEEARYEVRGEYGQFEVRDYHALVIAETEVDADYEEAGNIAFERLFAYISGDNVSNDKIAMTTPVIAEGGEAPEGEQIAMTSPVLGERQARGWRYAFVLPGSYTRENAPVPSNPDVTMAVMPKKKVAVIRYSGSRNEKSEQAKSIELANWMKEMGFKAISKPRSAAYDPPWTIPFLRRNEVMIDIE